MVAVTPGGKVPTEKNVARLHVGQGDGGADDVGAVNIRYGDIRIPDRHGVPVTVLKKVL
jgi:hypothetical protein